MTDKRRINGPLGGTRPTVFASSLLSSEGQAPIAREQPERTRKPNELRRICTSSLYYRNHRLTFDYYHSLENWPHSLGIGLRISRTAAFCSPLAIEVKVAHTSHIVSKAHLLCSWPQAATSFCSFFTESLIVHTRQVRPICHSPTKRLYSRH